jgi:hypothetical protein
MDVSKTLRTTVIGLSLASMFAGCKSTPATDDASLNTQVQTRLASDQNLGGQQIQASVSGGIVTLNGTVSSDTARTIASGDAAQVAGIRTVVDNLVVQGQMPVSTQLTTPPPPPAPGKMQKPSAAVQSHPDQERRSDRDRRADERAQARNDQQPPAPVTRDTPPPQPQQQPVAAQVAQVQAPPPPPPAPPPAPVAHDITLPAGTSIPVRITQTLDSATTQTGDKFTGVVASDIIVDGMVVLAQGTPVTGHVDAVQDAAHFKGSSLLTISLSSISHKGERIDVATDPYTKEGEGRGKNTAEKVGGGAAVGAILGGILGGGRGAAIGAAAGGGVGAGANGVTRGQQVQIPSETVVRFKLSDAIKVHVNAGERQPDNSAPVLERHDNQ